MAPDTSEKPKWWQENQKLREQMDLPDYEPPRFVDGVYTHEVTQPLEKMFNCTIQFAGVDPRYPDDWHVRVDRETIFAIGRYRDKDGNTVYEMDSETFEEVFREQIKTI